MQPPSRGCVLKLQLDVELVNTVVRSRLRAAVC